MRSWMVLAIVGCLGPVWVLAPFVVISVLRPDNDLQFTAHLVYLFAALVGGNCLTRMLPRALVVRLLGGLLYFFAAFVLFLPLVELWFLVIRFALGKPSRSAACVLIVLPSLWPAASPPLPPTLAH